MEIDAFRGPEADDAALDRVRSGSDEAAIELATIEGDEVTEVGLIRGELEPEEGAGRTELVTVARLLRERMPLFVRRLREETREDELLLWKRFKAELGLGGRLTLETEGLRELPPEPGAVGLRRLEGVKVGVEEERA